MSQIWTWMYILLYYYMVFILKANVTYQAGIWCHKWRRINVDAT